MRNIASKRQKGLIHFIPALMGMLLLAMLIIGLAPIFNTISTDMTFANAEKVYSLNGYTAYASPTGTFYVNDLLPNADSTYDVGASGNEFAEDTSILYTCTGIPLLLCLAMVRFGLRLDQIQTFV